MQKHGAERRRRWRKLHIGIDAQTLPIRVICVTSNNVSDAAVLPSLLRQLPVDEAYDTQPAHGAVTEYGALPIIPPRKNARIRKGSVFVHRNAAIAACRRLRRNIWKHRRPPAVVQPFHIGAVAKNRIAVAELNLTQTSKPVLCSDCWRSLPQAEPTVWAALQSLGNRDRGGRNDRCERYCRLHHCLRSIHSTSAGLMTAPRGFELTQATRCCR